ncbi:MAG: hypothetical protein ACRDHZ_25655, partial [Ktedonobacteraceae bacterium]
VVHPPIHVNQRDIVQHLLVREPIAILLVIQLCLRKKEDAEPNFFFDYLMRVLIEFIRSPTQYRIAASNNTANIQTE